MRQQDWLFPNVSRKVGWLIVTVLASFFLLLRTEIGEDYSDIIQNWLLPRSWSRYSDTVTNIFIIGFAIGLILIAFSREKQEDEMIQKLR